MTTTVGIYARISDDPTGTGLGVNRQVEDARALCDRRGWTPSPTSYVDNDLSAYKRSVVRPAFERLLEDLTSGEIQGIVVYDLDRFSRQPRDLERAIDIYEQDSSLVFASLQGDFDLAGDGKLMARVIAAFANKASADTARRVERKHLELAREGKPVGGSRPFGWEQDKATILEEEAVMVRDGIDRVLAGLSPRALAEAWNAAGATTTRGNPWSSKTVRQYMLNPRLAGLRTHRGTVMVGDDGNDVRGQWEPMITVDTFDRLVAALRQPEARSRVPRRGSRHYLLSGVLRCGVCARVMYGNSRGASCGLWYYVCSEADDHSLSAAGPAIDRLIRAAVLSRLQAVQTGEAATPTWPGRDRLETVRRQIAETMQAYRDGVLKSTSAFPLIEKLEVEQDTLERDRADWLDATIGPDVEPVTAEDWEAMHTDEQRALVESFFSTIVVKRPTRRSNRFDPARVEPVPRAAA